MDQYCVGSFSGICKAPVGLEQPSLSVLRSSEPHEEGDKYIGSGVRIPDVTLSYSFRVLVDYTSVT